MDDNEYTWSDAMNDSCGETADTEEIGDLS